MTWCRRLLIALFCATLPLSASAALLNTFSCAEAGYATPQIQEVAPSAMDHHAGHAAGTTEQQAAAQAEQGCDCVMQCGCPQHCTGSCAMTLPSLTTLAPVLPAYLPGTGSLHIPDARINSPFRPPITALS